MVSQGLNLMVYGMGTVFVFLTLLVLCTTVMSSLVTRFFPVSEPVETTSGKKAEGIPDQKLVKVIEAAIAQHRQK